MRKLKTYEKFLLKENLEMPEEVMNNQIEDQIEDYSEIDSEQSGDMTLYRLTSHPVVDLSQPGEFYVSKMEDVNPDLLENREGDDLYLITVTCPASNIDDEMSEVECAKHNCECIVVVKDDAQCQVVKVEPYKE
jgi:hypothetical protein